MKLSRFASFSLVLAAPLLTQCEPAYDVPPPATAQNAVAEPALPEPPPPAPAAATDGDQSVYASDEYALGEETDTYQDNDPSALTDFRGTLEPYGSWADDSTYGTVWVPSPGAVGADFVPYSTAGHWVYGDDYVWVSDYPWGWAPFHYGRWVFIEGRGWAWIPGRVYRGAWVTWGVDDGWGYVGWYPMAPGFLWWGGAAVGYSFYVGPRWVYCPRGEVFSPVVGTRVVTGAAAAPIASRVRVYTPATPGVASGPPPQKLGYAMSQVPHATGAEAAHLARAEQFARPSTAQPLGAHPPARLATPAASAAVPAHGYSTAGTSPRPLPPIVAAPGHVTTARPPVFGRAMPAPASAPVVRPPVSSGRTTAPTPVPHFAPAPAPHFAPAPAVRAAPPPAFHGGGGHHR